MNKIHKLVWSARIGGYVVTAETATSRGRAPSQLRVVAAVAAGLAGTLLSGHAVAIPSCAPAPTTVVSANTTSTVATSCPNESVTVNAIADVAGGTGLTNDSGGNGRIANLGSLLITGAVRGQNPIDLASTALSGGITNSGTIQSYWSGPGSGFGGPAVALNGVTLSGAINNSGLISGDYAGISLLAVNGPLVVNSGSITSQGIGLEAYASVVAEIRNEVGGTIHGNNYGISFRDSSAVQRLDNRGTVTAFGVGVAIFNSGVVAQFVNAAGATILGNQGIQLSAQGSIVDLNNAGRIEGSGSGLSLYDGTLSGTLTNAPTGVITGGSAGISMGTFNNPSTLRALVNQGLIEGSIGIDGHEGSVISQGIDNSGVIRGTQGIQLTGNSSISGGIVNSGTIEGTDYAIRVEVGSSLDRLDLTGTRASLIGDVDAATADVNVKSGAVFSTTNAFNVRTFTVEADAVLNLTAATHAAASQSADGVSVTDGFFNRGTVAVEAGTIGRVNGNYTQSAGGALQVGVNSVSGHGTLAVSGDATLAQGTTLKVAVGSGATFSPGDRVQGVVTSGGQLSVDVTPTTGLVVSDNSVRYKFTADTGRSTTELDLIVALDAAPFSSGVGSGSALKGVAANLDGIREGGIPPGMQPVFDRLFELSADELPAAMAQMVPVLMGAGPQAGVSALRSMNKIIQSRVESNQGLSAGNAASERYSWGRAFGTTGDQTSQGVVAGFRSATRGVVLGGDAPVTSKLRAGLAFTYARSDIDSRDSGAPSELDVNTYELVHYGSYNLDSRTDLNYQVDIGLNDVKGIRQILFMGQQANSDFSSTNVHASLGLGRSWSLSLESSVTPSVRVDYTRMKTKGYTETGAGALNLAVAGSTFTEFMLTADVKGSYNLGERTKLVGNASAGYDFVNKQAATTAAFVGGGTVFETQGLTTSPWIYRGGMGVMHDKEGVEYSVRYDIDRRTSGYTNQTLSARARWAF